MFLKKVNLESDHDIYLGGDIHEGAKSQDSEALLSMVQEIEKNPRGYFCGMGDYCEAIMVDDKRFELEATEMSIAKPILQYNSIKEKLLPVKDRTLLLLEGNHDYNLSRKLGSLVAEWAREWKVSYGTYTSILQVCDKQDRQLYKLFLWHGRGTIKSRIDDGSERRHVMERALRRKLYLKMSDCLVMAMGHTHRLIVKPPETSVVLFSRMEMTPGKRIKQWYQGAEASRHNYIPPSGRWYVNTGGFTRMYVEGISTYNEVFDSDPLEIGYIKIYCRDGKIMAIVPITEEVKD